MLVEAWHWCQRVDMLALGCKVVCFTPVHVFIMLVDIMGVGGSSLIKKIVNM